MIAYEIQLWYVIRDKIQSDTKYEKNIFCQKKIVTKNLSWTLSQISSVQSELSRINRCLSSLSGTCIPLQASELYRRYLNKTTLQFNNSWTRLIQIEWTEANILHLNSYSLLLLVSMPLFFHSQAASELTLHRSQFN